MKALLAASLTLWALVYANPSFAQRVTVDGSVGYCEGCQSGTVSLTLSGSSEARVESMQPDADNLANYSGVGSVDYDGNGVSVHVANALFFVRMEPAPGGGCFPVSQFPAQIEAFDQNGVRILLAANLHYDDGISIPDHCPWGRLKTDVGVSIPDSRVRIRGLQSLKKPVVTSGLQSLGSVKAGYLRTVSGRNIKVGN